MKNSPINIDEFADPPYDYRPVVFWSWNEVMEPDEIRRQLRLMKEAGLGGGFIHSRVGLLTDYLGEEWFKAVEATIDESKRLGFSVYLYDEDKWPSGFAGGFVPLEDEAFRMKALIARPVDKKVPDDYHPLGEAFDGIQVYRWISTLGYDWFNGTCYGDLMSRDAMRFFIEQSYQSYYDRFGKYYGDDITLEFTDEPCTIFRGRLPEGSVPFSDDLPEAFVKLHHYEPTEHLHKLFVDTPDARRFRIHYFRTVNYLFENNFSKQISDWCSEHNIGLTGHYMLETEMYGQQLWGTKVMGNYRHQHRPGIDHLGRQIDEIISGKQCQSAINQAGKNRMLSELFGCSGQGATFEDRLWIATQQIQLGVNFLNPHLSLYTMSGCRKRDFPPNLFYQQPWWQANAEVDIPLARLCYAMSQGYYAADTLLLHPQESTFALWQSRYENCNDTLKSNNLTWDTEPTTPETKQAIETLDKAFKEMMLSLLDHQIQFDLGDETLIADDGTVEVVDNQPVFTIGQGRYHRVVLPSMHTIAVKTLQLLKEFADKGGPVYRCGEGPVVLDGQSSDELDAFLAALPQFDTIGLNEALQKDTACRIEAQNGNDHYLWVHIRDLENGAKLVMLSNLTRSKPFDGQVRLAGNFEGVYLLDHWTGLRQPVAFDAKSSSAVVDLHIEPVASVLLVFETDPAAADGLSLVEPEFGDLIVLNPDEFAVARLDDNAITLDKVTFAEGSDDLTDIPLPVVVIQEMLNEQQYDGPLTLEYSFEMGDLDARNPVRLVLEHPEHYRIWVNGQECQYDGLDHWLDIRFMPIDITGKLVTGTNTIRLECDNFQHGDKTNIEDTVARYGTEIESIYLVGDFAVQAELTEPVYDTRFWRQWGLNPGLQNLKDRTAKLVNSQPLAVNCLTESGLPFYAGRVEYSVTLPELADGSSDVYLMLEKLGAACAEVFVDDAKVGSIVTLPYRVDLSDSYKPGGMVRIRLYSTLRNLLGPHHHADGELDFNSPLSFLPELEEDGTYTDLARQWLAGTANPKKWNDDYSLLNFGDIGQVCLKYYSKTK